MNPIEEIMEKARRQDNTVKIINLVVAGLAFVIALVALIIALTR